MENVCSNGCAISPTMKYEAVWTVPSFAHGREESVSKCQRHFTHHDLHGIRTSRLPLGIDDSVLKFFQAALAKRSTKCFLSISERDPRNSFSGTSAWH